MACGLDFRCYFCSKPTIPVVDEHPRIAISQHFALIYRTVLVFAALLFCASAYFFLLIDTLGVCVVRGKAVVKLYNVYEICWRT